MIALVFGISILTYTAYLYGKSVAYTQSVARLNAEIRRSDRLLAQLARPSSDLAILQRIRMPGEMDLWA